MTEQTLFAEALERTDPQERAGYLDQACQGDLSLRQRIERLLVQHEHAGDFLASPAGPLAPTIDAPAVERLGTQIGPYKLLQQIGEGGMGTVFMAEQSHPIQRKAALKIIKAGMDSKQVIARFEAERQALAMMDHVNIARVFDGGETPPAYAGGSPRPYFVMELVHGVPITKYCDDNHLTPRQRLELFVPVCQAIQHAHQKGIIHRDIKPSNIMITLYDGKPVPKVIDFGVAKATEQKLTERTLFTQYGTMVGTLEYMSPEQAEMSALGVDTRSDIYSLGVLLYELLTGNTPLTHKTMKDAAYAEILRMIKEEEPPRPSTRLSDSGEALASISANRHTEPAKLTKLVRGELDWIVMKCLEKDRNRRYETANGFAADVQRYLADEAVQACPPSAGYRLRKFVRRNKTALTMSSVIVLAILLVVGSVGWMVRDRAARDEEAARDRAARQVAVELEVNLALKEAERLQEQGKWPEALSAAKRAQGLLVGSGSDELRERVRLLRKDLEMTMRLEEIPLLSSEWKDTDYDYEAADRAYAQAFRDYGIDVADLPVENAAERIRARPGVALALVAALDDWAAARDRTGKAGGSALTAAAQAADSDPWRRQVREARERKDAKALVALAASPQLLRQPPTSLLVLARALRGLGLVKARIEVLRQAQRQYPGDFWINLTLAELTDRDEGVSFLRAALAVRPRSKAVHVNLGRLLRAQGKLEEASACYRKAIEIDPKFARAHNMLGLTLRDQKKLDEAMACYKNAIEIDPNNAPAHNNLGALLCDNLRDYENAIACFRKAIELDPKKAEIHVSLGNALLAQKKLDKAIESYRKALELDPKLAIVHYKISDALTAQGKLDEAIASIRRGIELDPLDPKNANAYANLGNALREQMKLDESIAAFKKALALNAQSAQAHNGLAWLLATCADAKLRDPVQAVALAKKAVELDPNHWAYPNTLGTAHYRAGDCKAAVAALEKSMVLRKGGDSFDWFFLAMAHWQLDDKDKARAWYDRAAQWMDKHEPANEQLLRFRAEAAELLGVEK